MATSTRFYLAPKIGTGAADDPYRPQHFVEADGLSWVQGPLICQDYGQEPTFLVTAQMTTPEHARILQTAPDVTVVEPPLATLDRPIGAFVKYLRPRLEAAGFPALWVERPTTTRAILRHLQRCIHLAQRMQRFGRLFPAGLTLDSHLLHLTPAHHQMLVDAVVAGGGTGDGLRPTMTLRAAITYLADQLPYPPRLLDVEL